MIPTWKQTFKFVARLAEKVTYGKIAKVSGKKTDVAEAWGRPAESDEFPSGTGKRDPSQTILRLIGLAHEGDPGLAREWAETFVEYVDFLDDRISPEDSIFELMARSVKEHADVVVQVLHEKHPDYARVYSEAMQAKSAINKIIACAREEMKK